MNRKRKVALAHAHPLWMRWLTSACLVLFAMAATAEAVHVHGQWLPNNKVQVHAPVESTQGNGEERCPLCVAMHPAMPVSQQAAPPPPVLSSITPVETAWRAPEAPWPFAMFSRPPPSVA